MNYEIIYITHLPSFYKNNIFNEIAKNKKILVIFIGKYSKQRKSDFIDSKFNFEHLFLQEIEFEKVQRIRTIKNLISILKTLSFNKIIVGGWELPHFWAALIYCKVFKKNIKTASIIESSIIESKLNFLKLNIKKLFLFFNDYVIAASNGEHKDLILKINPKKKIFIANGVGIPNLFYSNPIKTDLSLQMLHKEDSRQNDFLYIGRISKEKNIDLLINAFENDKHNFKLNIVGGELKGDFKNIKVYGYMNNKELRNFIKLHKALILVSISEPWGLVVDEALICGISVIISKNVGCGSDLIKPYNSGIIFENNNLEKFKKALFEMDKNYLQYQQNAKKVDFKKRYAQMQKAYCLES